MYIVCASDLSRRVDTVKEENLKLKSENLVLGQYIENLMEASAIFQSTVPQPKKSVVSCPSLIIAQHSTVVEVSYFRVATFHQDWYLTLRDILEIYLNFARSAGNFMMLGRCD